MTDVMPDTTSAAGPIVGTPFTALAMVEGLETSDGRFFELGTTTWRPLPLPFMVRDTAVHGPNEVPAPTWAAGQIEQIDRDPTDPSRIIMRGHLMPNEDGARAEELARHSFRGVSVDGYGDSPLPAERQATVVDQNGDPIAMLIRYNDTVISGLTMVPTPAFEACCLWFDDEEPPAAAALAHGGVLDPDAPPQVMQIADPYEQLVASAGGPLNPPRGWFFTPEPDEYQPIEVTRDGHVTGHIARAGQCHLTIMEQRHVCKTAPPSQSVPPFKAFHRTVAQCADGSELACGWIAADTKHASTAMRVGAGQAADHYDNTATLAAKVRLSNGRHGTWCSGALLPGLDDRRLAIMQGPEVSGDWRPWTDPDTGVPFPSEIVAVLCVPQPALPGTRTRPELLVASDGAVVGMFGHLEPCDCDDEMEEIMDLQAEEAPDVEEPVLVASAGALGDVDASYADELVASMDDPIVALTAQERARYFAKYDQAARDKAAKNGHSMPDGSYIIEDDEDLQNAIRAVGRGGASHDAIRRFIMRRAREMGKAARIPSTWNADGSLKG